MGHAPPAFVPGALNGAGLRGRANFATSYFLITLASMNKPTLLRIGIVLALIAGYVVVAVLRSGTAW